MQDFIDFINKFSGYIWLFFEIVAALTGLLLLKKYKLYQTSRYFIYFLLYVVIFSVMGRYTYWVQDGPLEFLKGTLLQANYWLFTICWSIISVLFFGWYYLQILKNKKSKSVLKVSLIVFTITSFMSILITWPKFFKSNINSIKIFGAVIILQCVIYYFLEVLKGDKILHFYKSLTFYISCAILLLWLIQTPMIFFQPYYRTADMEYVYLRDYINLVIISFMYITYTVGLLVSKPNYD